MPLAVVSVHVPGFVVPRRKYAYVVLPLGCAVPCSVAVVAATGFGATVVTAGASSVVNDNTAP